MGAYGAPCGTSEEQIPNVSQITHSSSAGSPHRWELFVLTELYEFPVAAFPFSSISFIKIAACHKNLSNEKMKGYSLNLQKKNKDRIFIKLFYYILQTIIITYFIPICIMLY